MRYTYEQPEYLDVDGARHLVQELKVYIQEILNGNIDITQYATKEELSNAVSSIDLTDYAKTSDIPSLDGYAKSTDIPSLDGYATKSYVDENIANVATGGEVDLSNYVTKDTVYTKEETNALIPSTEGLATETYVDNAVSNVPTTDLTGYATEEYVSTAINSIPATDLSNYYTKSETYSKTEVDTLVANSGGGSSSGGGEVYSTEEIAIGKWIDGKTIYRKVISMDLPSVKSGQTHSAIAVVGNGTTPCNIMMLDWRAVSYAGLTGSNYDYPSRIIHGDGFKSAVVWTTKNNISSLTQELCRDMLSVFHAGNPTSSYINCYYGSSFASRRCDFIIDYLKIETA